MFGIRAGAAFDGEQAIPGGALVLLDGVRIAGVEPGTAPAPDGREVLEVPGGTVLPGLVDAHVHLCADGTDGSLDRIQEPSEDGMRQRRVGEMHAAGVRLVSGTDGGVARTKPHGMLPEAGRSHLTAPVRLCPRTSDARG
jgi:hypothetical protein